MISSSDLFSELNAGMLDERYGAFVRNVAKNRPLIGRFGGLRRIVPLLNGRQVIVAGAGPSLERSLPALERSRLNDEVIIIAADMALKPLVERGVSPGFVISCETRPSAFFSGVDTSGMHLLAFSCMSHSNLMSWRGDMSFYNWMIHDEPFASLWEQAGRDLGFVATASIVTTQAVSMALGCSASSISLVGNDMAFRDRFYVRGAEPAFRNLLAGNRCRPPVSVEFDSARAARAFEIRRGERVYYTSGQFLAAKMWLEKLFRGHGCPVYDCSVPGCSEGAVMKSDLERLLNFFMEKRNNGA
jgi:hypothetical protein